MTALSLVRKVFTTSRLAEFCSEKKLINQTGHDSDDWLLVVLKELIDNALDACEEAGAAPFIHVADLDAEIAVFDNGPGIAPDTIASTTIPAPQAARLIAARREARRATP